MTPLMSQLAKALANWSGPWDAEMTGVTGPIPMLRALVSSEVFQIEEAETDIERLRTVDPDHYETTANFHLPVEAGVPVWIEYKVYDPTLHATGERSALWALQMPDGAIRCWIASGGDVWGAVPILLFEIAGGHVRSPATHVGSRLRYQATEAFGLANHAAAQTMLNFALELIETINYPGPPMRRETAKPSATVQRRVKDVLGAKCHFRPYTILTVGQDTAAFIHEAHAVSQ